MKEGDPIQDAAVELVKLRAKRSIMRAERDEHARKLAAMDQHCDAAENRLRNACPVGNGETKVVRVDDEVVLLTVNSAQIAPLERRSCG